MNNISNVENGASGLSSETGEVISKVSLVESIARFNYEAYKEEEDADYKPEPGVEEEIIQEYQDEAEQLQTDEIYHDFVETINVDTPLNINNAEEGEEDEDTEFVADQYEGENDEEGGEKDKVNTEGADSLVDCDSAAYDSTCTETDLEEEEAKQDVGDEELKLLAHEVPVKIPKSSLLTNQTQYPPFWRFKHAMQNVDAVRDSPEYDPDYSLPFNGLSTENQNNGEGEKAEALPRDLQLRARLVHTQVVGADDSSDASEGSDEEEDEEADDKFNHEELEIEINALKEQNLDGYLSEQVKGMVEMIEEMSFVAGGGEENDATDAGNGKKVLGTSNYFLNSNAAASTCQTTTTSIVDAIAKFDERTYEEDEDADYCPNENKENEICMQE